MYLIDGNNLIGHTKSMSHKDPRARQILLDRLQPFLELKRRKATVVFDGTSEPLKKTRWMHLVFSGTSATADDNIRGQVEASKASKELCVVSSDNGVYGYARTCGVTALRCHEFNRLLKENEQRVAPENRDLQIENLQHWLRYFGEEE